jgi:hypothetical protein
MRERWRSEGHVLGTFGSITTHNLITCFAALPVICVLFCQTTSIMNNAVMTTFFSSMSRKKQKTQNEAAASLNGHCH